MQTLRKGGVGGGERQGEQDKIVKVWKRPVLYLLVNGDSAAIP